MSATKPNFQYNWNIGDIESIIHKLTNRYPLNERKKIDQKTNAYNLCPLNKCKFIWLK